MMEQTSRLLGLYAKRGVLIDANILLLYLIGSYDRSLISRFKRTRQFTVEDYATLLLLLHPFEAVITTPNILISCLQMIFASHSSCNTMG